MHLILFSLLLFLSSCARLPEFPVEDCFPGIKNELDCQQSVSLLIIHGLGGFADKDPSTLNQQIQEKLKLCKISEDFTYDIEKGGCKYGSLVYADFAGCSGNLRIYNLYWQDSTILPRELLKNIDSPTQYMRLPMVSKLKDNYVDNAVADGLLYVSSYRKEIQYPFERTIARIQRERPQDPIIVIGFSLGSTILIDTLDEMCEAGVAKSFICRLRQMFMLSNPSPLFDLAKLNCINSQYRWQWQNWALGRFIYEKRKTDPGFRIVAISDPNDALSYIVKDQYMPSECGMSNIFINQRVRNVQWTFLGLINPITAHTGYGKNPKVQDMIIFGGKGL